MNFDPSMIDMFHFSRVKILCFEMIIIYEIVKLRVRILKLEYYTFRFKISSKKSSTKICESFFTFFKLSKKMIINDSQSS